MKKLLLLLFLSMFLVGCMGPMPDHMKGEHKLRKMVEVIGQKGEISGGFFLLSGAFTGSSEVKRTITFAWYNSYSDAYVISTMDIEHVMVKIADVSTPTVRFIFTRSDIYTDEMNDPFYIFRRYVRYIRITCKAEDWPVDVQMPLNNK